ncbi:MAG: DNA replication and repair protein RecF [Lentisphaerae bacterium]|nr:DNA replication and repair protein RecF [Lentisphaerota bacterium]
MFCNEKVVVESIELTNFRNVESRKLVFHSRNIFFEGPNGAGKSNLLESIGFASLLRSFRGASPREMIRLGAREFQIKAVLPGKFAPETLLISESLSGKRRLFINDEPIRRSSDFIREFHTVVFAPEDREIAAGTSGCRRRFFDILISEIEPEYLLRLSRYHRALLQRNRALKFAPHTAEAFEAELSEQAPYIASFRRNFAQIIGERCSALLGGRGDFHINYRTDTPENSVEHRKLLASKRESELRRQCTLCGIQLDEFDLIFDGKLLRTYGSTGQIRLISLLLKLAQFQEVQSKSTAPVAVLADDVTGELDKHNLELFLSTVSHADQKFFTFAAHPEFQLPDTEVIPVGKA